VRRAGRGRAPVDEALDDRHLRLLELTLRVAAGGVREVDGMADLDVVRERDVLDLDAARARRSAPAGCGRGGTHSWVSHFPNSFTSAPSFEISFGRAVAIVCVRWVGATGGGGGGEEEVGGSRELYSFYSGLRALPFCQTGIMISRTLCCCTEHNAKVLFHWLGDGSISLDDCGHEDGCISAADHGSGFHHDLDPRASQVLASRSQIQVLFL
jgi:hypothetical protein